MNKSWIIGVIVLVLVIGGLSYWGYKTNTGKTQVSGASTVEDANYFDDTANVMYFYQDSCSYCIKEKEVLKKLGDEGYRVKSMNIGSNHPENQSAWKTNNPDGEYKITGTPYFIAKNGDRLEGYQDYDKLKAFLDNHK